MRTECATSSQVLFKFALRPLFLSPVLYDRPTWRVRTRRKLSRYRRPHPAFLHAAIVGIYRDVRTESPRDEGIFYHYIILHKPCDMPLSFTRHAPRDFFSRAARDLFPPTDLRSYTRCWKRARHDDLLTVTVTLIIDLVSAVIPAALTSFRRRQLPISSHPSAREENVKMSTGERKYGNIRAFFSPRMLNLTANMVSHIKRMARTNKPFRIASKYSDEVSSSSRHRAGYIRSLATPLPHGVHGDYGRRVWSLIEATTSKARTRALAAMSAITEARFTQLSTGVIFVSRLPPFPGSLPPTNAKIVIVDRRSPHVEKSHVPSSNCSRGSLDTTTTTTTISAMPFRSVCWENNTRFPTRFCSTIEWKSYLPFFPFYLNFYFIISMVLRAKRKII